MLKMYILVGFEQACYTNNDQSNKIDSHESISSQIEPCDVCFCKIL